ncbi:hypothetical protein [Pelolinea submarina]|uniref:Uncharacterized protein n=1 Tax=Pelolinea submarina TaxID=913107 RepID=A0A347ZVN9_9CHLR|nr:hypothetical protein [Pelolinea submarina]REG07065.1 hypothetical protein DFR64_2268 [Pelolinea submarina]BBB49370.1 hypothetical protein Pelsub_P2601 [Pelolinea submarina]
MNSKQPLSGGNSPAREIRISPKQIFWILTGIALLLAAASLYCQYLTYFKHADLTKTIALWDVDTELSLPSIYSVFLLFIDCLLLALITMVKKKEKAALLGTWIFLTVGFLFLTFDEGACIHEKLMTPVRQQLGDDLPSYFYFTWVIPALVAIIFLGFLFLKFLKNLTTKARIGFILSAAVYLGGALGMELIGGSFASEHGLENFNFNLLSTIEESLEMVGASLFARTLLTYISDTYSGLRLRFNSAGPR